MSWRLRCVPVPMIKKVGPEGSAARGAGVRAGVDDSIAPRKRISFKNVAEHPKVLKHLENSGSFTLPRCRRADRAHDLGRAEGDEPAVPAEAARRDRRADHLLERRDLLNEEAKVFGEFLKTRKPAA